MLTSNWKRKRKPFRVPNKCYKPDGPEDDVVPGSRESYLPKIVYLELIPNCNNQCSGCSNELFTTDLTRSEMKPNSGNRSLTGEEWEQILDRFDSLIALINLTGGEPTLHSDFEAITTSINRREIDFVVFTNARWCRPKQLVNFLASLSHFKGFLVSLHGASPETHETFTGITGSFQETVTNINLAVRAGLTVSTSTVITHQNVSDLIQIAGLSRELGTKATIFNRYLVPITPEGQLLNNDMLADMMPTRNELRTAIGLIENLRQQTDKTHHIDYGPCIPQCFTPSSSRGCSAGEMFLVIDSWGNVKPCTDVELFCGNLLAQTLEEVWRSQAMQLWHEFIPSGCSNCATLNQCRTGCRAMALASGTGRDPLMGRPIPLFPSVPEASIRPVGVKNQDDWITISP
jgi:AdoMet-dependent heme synthase